MDLALALARETHADLVIANDPDADRLAVAIPEDPGSGKPYPMPCGKCARHTLPKGPEYVVQTPAIVTAEDGTVVAVCTDTDRPGAVEEALRLASPPAPAPTIPRLAGPLLRGRAYAKGRVDDLRDQACGGGDSACADWIGSGGRRRAGGDGHP